MEEAIQIAIQLKHVKSKKNTSVSNITYYYVKAHSKNGFTLKNLKPGKLVQTINNNTSHWKTIR